MPAERTTMRQVRELLRLKFVGGVPTREIARRIGVAPSTVRAIIRRFQAAGLSWPLPDELTWRRHYNQVRPHSSLDYLTPNEFVARLANAAPRQATGQGAAVCGPPRPGPLLHPLRKEHMQEHREPVST